MEKLRECVKSIQQDGLIWGADKFVPVGYGINKLQVRVLFMIRFRPFHGVFISIVVVMVVKHLLSFYVEMLGFFNLFEKKNLLEFKFYVVFWLYINM